MQLGRGRLFLLALMATTAVWAACAAVALQFVESHTTIIEHGAAHYDSVTGKLVWNDETTTEKKR